MLIFLMKKLFFFKNAVHPRDVSTERGFRVLAWKPTNPHGQNGKREIGQFWEHTHCVCGVCVTTHTTHSTHTTHTISP